MEHLGQASFEALEATRSGSRFVFTCEHAGRDVPPPLVADDFGPDLLTSHNGWDPGAGPITRRLADRFGAPAVLGRYTRLLVDLNRSPAEGDYVRRTVEGRTIRANRDLTPLEKERRTARFHAPFHQAVDRLLAARRSLDPILISVHTFTACWRDRVRPMEYGLLFNDHHELVAATGRRLAARGRVVAYNEPYSGKEGKIYSINRHGRSHRLRYFEIEVRNDLLTDEAGALAIADELAAALGPLDESPGSGRS